MSACNNFTIHMYKTNDTTCSQGSIGSATFDPRSEYFGFSDLTSSSPNSCSSAYGFERSFGYGRFICETTATTVKARPNIVAQ